MFAVSRVITVRMLVTVIPFLLAAQITPNYLPINDDWQYDAEMTFNVLVKQSRSDIDPGNFTYCSTISADLKCHVKNDESLLCYFLNPITSLSTINNNSKCEWSRDYSIAVNDSPFDQEPFEIKYNPDGIDVLVVSETIPRWKLYVTKLVVSHLQVGFEMTEENDMMETIKISNMDHCDFDLEYTSIKNEYPVKHVLNNSELTLISPFLIRNFRHSVDRDVELIIEKSRNIDNCPRRSIYFFGFPTSHSDTNRGTLMHMVSSTTRMVINNGRFSSETISEGVPKTSKKLNGLSHQKITLNLRSVNLAENLPPTIYNPTSTSIYINSCLDPSDLFC